MVTVVQFIRIQDYVCRIFAEHKGRRKMRMGRYNGRGSIVSGVISFIAAVIMIIIGTTAFNAGVPNIFMFVFLVFGGLFVYDGVRNIKGAIERGKYEKEQDEISFSEELRRSHQYSGQNAQYGAQRRDERQQGAHQSTQTQFTQESGTGITTCPGCGAPVGSDFKFCGNCGRKL